MHQIKAVSRNSNKLYRWSIPIKDTHFISKVNRYRRPVTIHGKCSQFDHAIIMTSTSACYHKRPSNPIFRMHRPLSSLKCIMFKHEYLLEGFFWNEFWTGQQRFWLNWCISGNFAYLQAPKDPNLWFPSLMKLSKRFQISDYSMFSQPQWFPFFVLLLLKEWL